VTGLVIGLLLVAWLVLMGVDLQSAVLVTAARAVHTAAGASLWLIVRASSQQRAGAIEALGMGFALGSIISMLSGVMLRPLVPGGWG
jgi:hypothetical protein